MRTSGRLLPPGISVRKDSAANDADGRRNHPAMVRPSCGNAVRRTARCAVSRRRFERLSARTTHEAIDAGSQPRSRAIARASRRRRPVVSSRLFTSTRSRSRAWPSDGPRASDPALHLATTLEARAGPRARLQRVRGRRGGPSGVAHARAWKRMAANCGRAVPRRPAAIAAGCGPCATPRRSRGGPRRRCWASRLISRPSGDLPAGGSTLDEAAEAALADEGAVADHRAAAHEDRADGAGYVEALVGRVVAGVVEVAGPKGSAGGGIEQDEVRVAPQLARPLALQAAESGRCRGNEIVQPSD